MNRLIVFFVALTGLCSFFIVSKPDVKKDIEIATQHLNRSLTSNKDSLKFPRSTKPDGSYNPTNSADWTSGFYAGILWQMFEKTKDRKWEFAARRWTAGLEKEKFNTHTHDLGFMLYC